MALLVPKEIVHKIEVSDSTISLVQYVTDKIDTWFRGSIFWRGK